MDVTSCVVEEDSSFDRQLLMCNATVGIITAAMSRAIYANNQQKSTSADKRKQCLLFVFDCIFYPEGMWITDSQSCYLVLSFLLRYSSSGLSTDVFF